MSALGKLVKRNCAIYFKDRGTVFFSMLSMFIVIMVMLVFLGDMNIRSLENVFAQYSLVPVDAVQNKANATEFVLQWTIAGMVVVNCVTVTMTVIGNMVNDKVKGKMTSFYVAPISRATIILGYVFASMIASLVMSVLTVMLAEGYLVMQGYEFISAAQMIKVLGIIVVTVFTSASLMLLLAICVNTESSWSGLGTLIGTLVGFVGGIYLPIGSLPKAVGSVMKALPILHETSMMREVLLSDVAKRCFADMPAEVKEEVYDEMGIAIKMFDHEINASFQVLFMVAYGIIAFVIATVILKKKGVRDR